MSTKTIGECMTPNPVTIPADLSLGDAAQRMFDLGIRHLPVMAGGHIVGLVSDRDIAVVLGIPGMDRRKSEVTEAMSPNPYIVAPSTPLENVIQTMVERKVGTAVVMENGEMRGIFSVVDALGVLLLKLRAE